MNLKLPNKFPSITITSILPVFFHYIVLFSLHVVLLSIKHVVLQLCTKYADWTLTHYTLMILDTCFSRELCQPYYIYASQ